MSDFVICRLCGSQNFKEAEFCLICGGDLPRRKPVAGNLRPPINYVQQQKAIVEESNANQFKFIFAGVILLVLISGYFFISRFMALGGGKPPEQTIAQPNVNNTKTGQKPVNPDEPGDEEVKKLIESPRFVQIMKDTITHEKEIKSGEDICLSKYGYTPFDNWGKTDWDESKKLQKQMQQCIKDYKPEAETGLKCECNNLEYNNVNPKFLEANSFKDIPRYGKEGKVSEVLVLGANKYFKILKTCICNSNKLKGVAGILVQMQNINGGGWELMSATKINRRRI